MPTTIEALETEQNEIHEKMADPELYRDKEAIVKAKARLAEVETELSDAYERWEYLESVEE